MSKCLIIATANICLATFPPLVGFYGVWPAFTQWLLRDPARACVLGLVLGRAYAAAGIVSAISTSPGEHK